MAQTTKVGRALADKRETIRQKHPTHSFLGINLVFHNFHAIWHWQLPCHFRISPTHCRSLERSSAGGIASAEFLPGHFLPTWPTETHSCPSVVARPIGAALPSNRTIRPILGFFVGRSWESCRRQNFPRIPRWQRIFDEQLGNCGCWRSNNAPHWSVVPFK